MGNPFYLFVGASGARIFHKYIDSAGQKKSEVIRSFPIHLYVQGKERSDSSRGLMGEILNKVEFSEIDDAQEFIKEYQSIQRIHGQTNLLYQFISHRYPETVSFDFKKITILAIDIETAYDSSGFPTPQKANQQVLSIATKVFGEKQPFIVFGTKHYSRDNLTFIQCDDEEDLFRKFQKYWREINPDIVTGWNVEGFDIPYIVNRSNRLMGEDFTRKFSCFSDKLERCINEYSIGGRGSTYQIFGTTIIDYLELYKKYSGTTLESYRLDVVAQHELGTGKINYDDYGGLMGLYEKNYDLFIHYNKTDVELIEQLESKLNYLVLATTVAYLGKIRFSDIYSQVRFWDNHIYNALLERGIQIPPIPNNPQEEIVGAYVKDPIPALYHWVVTVDLTSLYPSIIMSANLSPETLVTPWQNTLEDVDSYLTMERDLSWAKTDNVCVIANGSTYRRDKQGIFPELVKDMFNQRKAFKKRAIQASQEIEDLKARKASPSEIDAKKSEEAIFDAKQQAYKIALNSLYGASANRFFRYNNRSISEGITMTGQLIIRFISNQLNAHLNTLFKTQDEDYIIFNDTDSAGLNLKRIVDRMFSDQSDTQKIVNFLDKFIKVHIDPLLESEFARLADYLNVYENMLSMKREVIADRGLWRGKKHYILQVWDKEGIRYNSSKLKMMGIETAKSSTPKIVRGSLEAAIRIILNQTESDLQDYVKTFKKQFWDADAASIAFPRGVSDIDKWIDTDGKLKKGVPIHSRGSILYNRLIKKMQIESTHPAIKNGDKIKFLYLKAQNPTHSNVIAFIDVLPSEFGLDEFIDRDTQFEKTFLDPLKSFASIVGWSTEETNSIDSYFS
jgi:DNA polymerase elongation subunit (family B)